MNILIVDDIAVNRKLLAAQLEAEGHRTFQASDGVQALQSLERESVDAVVSDILMPEMDGFCLCHEVRKSERFHALPFILFTSSYNSASDQQLGQTVGADGYILKPAPVVVILDAIAEALRKSSKRKLQPGALTEEIVVLKQYNAAMVRKLQETNAELQVAMEKLERIHVELESSNHSLLRKHETIQNFYHAVSHELKTPLTAAREFVSLIKEGTAGPVTKTQAEYLAIAGESCDQIAHSLNDLLDATLLDTGKLSLDLQAGSVTKLAQQVLKSFEQVMAAKSITVEKNLRDHLPDVALDKSRLSQVLSNLLTNAVKFTPVGGHIVVEVNRNTSFGFLEVSVSDSGRGIPLGEQERIFDQLHQVKQGYAATAAGLGLGLYLCRELILLHGGEIRVESEMGRGSRFSFTLPISLPDQFTRSPELQTNACVSKPPNRVHSPSAEMVNA